MKSSKWIALILVAGTIPAKAVPPHAPNFCTANLCIEVIRLQSSQTKIASQFDFNDGSEQIDILSDGRSAKIRVEKVNGSVACAVSSNLELNNIDGAYIGDVLSRVSENSQCLHVSMSFSRNDEVDSTRSNLPVTAIWVVDGEPLTFWEHGYSLRLGPEVDVRTSTILPN